MADSGEPQLYQASTLGRSLQRALDEMEAEEHIPPHLKALVMERFDIVMPTMLHDLPQKMPLTSKPADLQGELRDGDVKEYKFVNNTWTFVLKSATLKGKCFTHRIPATAQQKIIGGAAAFTFGPVRIVACDAKCFGRLPPGPRDLGWSKTDDSSVAAQRAAPLQAAAPKAARPQPKPRAAEGGGGGAGNRGGDADDSADEGEEGGLAFAQDEDEDSRALTIVEATDGGGAAEAGDDDDDFIEEDDDDGAAGAGSGGPAASTTAGAAANDDDDDGFIEEDGEAEQQSKRARTEPAAHAGMPGGPLVAAGGAIVGAGDAGEEEELNSDDDDDDEGAEGGGDGACDNLILAQFDSLKRKKTRYSLALAAGVARLGGVEYVFRSCDCDIKF